MKIEYTLNPLETKIFLDDHEKEILKMKIRVEEYEDLMYSAYHTLTHHDWWNSFIAKNGENKPMRTLQDTVNEAVKELDPRYWMIEDDGKKTKMEDRVEELFTHYVEELQGSHLGDCTCFAMSCSKCHAEDLLGVNTIEGLGKHSAYKIETAFSRWNPTTKKHDGPVVSLDEALEKLKGKDSSAAAYEWLLYYKQKHFTST